MYRLAVSAALLLPLSFAQAQTTLKITNSDNTTCTYSTGQVKSNAVPGQLEATATAPGTGNGCGGAPGSGGPPTFGPASDLVPLTTVMASAGGSTAFSFQANYASSCTATVTGASGGTVTNPVCSSTQGCGNASFSVNFPANTTTSSIDNHVQVTCTGTVSPAALSASAKVTVNGQGVIVPGSCPTVAGTYTQWGAGGTTNMQTVSYFGAFNGVPQSVDVTNFDSTFFGAWPGQYGLNADFLLPTNKYISLKFTVPKNYMTATNVPAGLYGRYQTGQSGHSANTSFTISQSCGDFSNPSAANSTVVAGCYANNAPTGGSIRWAASGNCSLTNETTYYLNLINADITNVLPGGGGTAPSTAPAANPACTMAGCSVPILNGPGSWQGYTPN